MPSVEEMATMSTDEFKQRLQREHDILRSQIPQSSTVKLTVPQERLRALADLYEAKNKEYGDAYKNVGEMASGMGLPSTINWSKTAILCVMMYKLQRYCANLDCGHGDSLDDLAVYAMMLREIDDDQR